MPYPIATIERNGNGYSFAVYPGNSRRQEYGKSPIYETVTECEMEWFDFRAFIIDNGISTIKSQYIDSNVDEPGESGKQYIIKTAFGKTVFIGRLYGTKKSCRDGVARLYRDISKITEIEKG